jgi:hypothetical protein
MRCDCAVVLVFAPLRGLRCTSGKELLMLPLDSCNLKISLPLLIALFLVAQVDLACATGWPSALLTLLHLTPAPDDQLRSMCAGLGVSLDVFVTFQFARILVRRRMSAGKTSRQK